MTYSPPTANFCYSLPLPAYRVVWRVQNRYDTACPQYSRVRAECGLHTCRPSVNSRLSMTSIKTGVWRALLVMLAVKISRLSMVFLHASLFVVISWAARMVCRAVCAVIAALRACHIMADLLKFLV